MNGIVGYKKVVGLFFCAVGPHCVMRPFGLRVRHTGGIFAYYRRRWPGVLSGDIFAFSRGVGL